MPVERLHVLVDGVRAEVEIVGDLLLAPPARARGRAAIHAVLDAMEDTASHASWRGRRPRIEHGDLPFPPDFARAHDLGVVIVQNATHLALTPVFAQRFTPAVFSELEPLRSLLDEGIPLALGTDGAGLGLRGARKRAARARSRRASSPISRCSRRTSSTRRRRRSPRRRAC
jgi:hypothetical protein